MISMALLLILQNHKTHLKRVLPQLKVLGKGEHRLGITAEGPEQG